MRGLVTRMLRLLGSGLCRCSPRLSRYVLGVGCIRYYPILGEVLARAQAHLDGSVVDDGRVPMVLDLVGAWERKLPRESRNGCRESQK